MSLAEHLRELRRRILIAMVGILLGAIVGWILAGPIWDALREPILSLTTEQDRELARLNYTEVTSAFMLRLQMAVTFGFVISAPIWLWQAWAYLLPALTKGERRGAMGFILAAVPLFFAGCTLAVFLIPYVLRIMTGFAAPEEAVLLNATTYFDFVFRFVVAIGVGFLLPVVLVLLNVIGVLSAKSIRKGWRVTVLIVSIFAAIVTPPADIVSMLALIGVMLLLFLVAIVITTLRDRARAKRFPELYSDATA